MDTILGIVMILASMYMFHISFELIKKQNIQAYYRNNQYEHIDKKFIKEYAKELGYVLLLLGFTFLLAGCLNIIYANWIKEFYIGLSASILLLIGICVGIFFIMRLNKKYKANQQ